MPEAPIVARNAKISRAYSEAHGRVFAEFWKYRFEVVATEEERFCCDLRMGHKTKKTARACLVKAVGELLTEAGYTGPR